MKIRVNNCDDSCNESKERTQKIIQENECKAENDYGDIGSNNAGGNVQDFICTNTVIDPNTGNSNLFNQQEQP